MKKNPFEFDKEKAIQKAEDFGEHATEKQVSEVRSKIDKFIKGPMKKVGDKIKQLWQFYAMTQISVYYTRHFRICTQIRHRCITKSTEPHSCSNRRNL